MLCKYEGYQYALILLSQPLETSLLLHALGFLSFQLLIQGLVVHLGPPPLLPLRPVLCCCCSTHSHSCLHQCRDLACQPFMSVHLLMF